MFHVTFPTGVGMHGNGADEPGIQRLIAHAHFQRTVGDHRTNAPVFTAGDIMNGLSRNMIGIFFGKQSFEVVRLVSLRKHIVCEINQFFTLFGQGDAVFHKRLLFTVIFETFGGFLLGKNAQRQENQLDVQQQRIIRNIRNIQLDFIQR